MDRILGIYWQYSDTVRETFTRLHVFLAVHAFKGGHLCPPIYGYKKSDTDKNLWVIDEPVARKIFQLCINKKHPK